MRYIVFIRRTGTGYSADIPDLPGCIATGMTVEHTRQQIAEAAEGHVEVMREHGEEVPRPGARLDFLVDEDMGEEYCTWIEVEAEKPAPDAEGRRGGVKTRRNKRQS
jgi:predicted RNase H-like HicB family nuclease